ncbi:HET-domain-containing protein [Cucurbitaria berberidis CBS 394.84]|uniref:HET-domain-containing protein n=1 Tax=Cucurbitaria berberidis CBS 394.84 TaxID=1168544 RepID=A0A9P4LAT1_9PLEO|nr:HET-domain-containing protein [Cucurbitaria berberidis CBS 394.84]KAF1847823.1 HET-domain-containing protein [Cucurbitaria berberidis CBS 394.84]
MRLIDTSTGAMKEFHGRDIPRYAILTHTWAAEEVTYQEYINGGFELKKGYEKIWKTCAIAKAAAIEYAWIDTCCIDKSSSAELSEAINSMYRWYERSAVCYAFIADLSPDAELEDALGKCRWFTRGWTLQELIAPKEVIFFDSDWKMRTTKNSSSGQLSNITNIDSQLLVGCRTLSDFSVAQKMSWAARRKTTRIEDEAYCLLGIFDLHMPLLYGEADKAFRRLQEEIIRYTADLSIFGWTLFSPYQLVVPEDSSSGIVPVLRPAQPEERILCGVLAESPAEFSDCHDYINHEGELREFSTSNVGIKTRVPMLMSQIGSNLGVSYVLPINCSRNGMALGIRLRHVQRGRYLRENPSILYSYKPHSMLMAPAGERYLLTQMPKESQYRDSRFASMSIMLPQMRSSLLQITKGPSLNISRPWPLDTYDHEDQTFFLTYFGRDFGTVKLNFRTHLRHPDGEGVTCSYRFCSLGWSARDPLRAQFGIMEEDAHGGTMDHIQQLASNGDWQSGSVLFELRNRRVPKSSFVRIDHTGNQSVIVSFTTHVTQDASIARAHIWKIHFSHKVCRTEDAPQFDDDLWTPDAYT